MQFAEDNQAYMIILAPNEPVIATLTQFCIDHEIENGQLSGIGAIKEIELGAYLLDKQVYVKQTFDDIYELVSAQGNIALKNGQPFIHMHITIGDHDLNVKGGHLFEAKVGVVAEFYLRKSNTQIYRELDPAIGLATCRCPAR